MTVTCNYFSIKTQGNTSNDSGQKRQKEQDNNNNNNEQQQNGENSDDNMAYECPKEIIKREWERELSQLEVFDTLLHWHLFAMLLEHATILLNRILQHWNIFILRQNNTEDLKTAAIQH